MNERQLAGCVITDDQNRVYLLHRVAPFGSEWELPGGKVEDGETPPEAAAREAYEELGVRVANLAILGTTQFSSPSTHWHYTWFRAEVVEGTPVVNEPDRHNDIRTFDLTDPQIDRIRTSTNVYHLSQAIKSGEVTL